jgi:hypothetical protein
MNIYEIIKEEYEEILAAQAAEDFLERKENEYGDRYDNI